MKRYSEYFIVSDDYCPIMTSVEINKSPDRWLDFYPHTEFEQICNTLLSVLETGEKSVWITGNFGTGKSNAALVLQKLFTDDESRVRKWFDSYDKNGLTDRQSLEKGLFGHRTDGTLVVYDSNATGIGPNEDLLVRLEKGIISTLNERRMIVPAMSNLDSVIVRIRREGANFFATRDTIQSQLAYLHAGIKTPEQLMDALNKEHKTTDTPSYLLDDVQRVLHKDNIYLDVNVATFRTWITNIIIINNLKRIIYIFDEFHPFIEANKEQLKTFEDVAESPGINRFFLVPVTHMQIGAYLAEGSDSAKKANDRFYFRQLKMPNDTAFRLAKHAMKDVIALSDEWKKEKDNLWTAVSSIVDKFNDLEDPKRESFYNILPIHPMAAFLLKFLSESAKSNQRSFFEYLKGGQDSKEFQDFLRAGGPDVANKQFLTVDYLWDYFVNRNDLGLDNDISAIGLTYKQIRDREFANQMDDAVELRVLKAVLLFCLLDKLAPGGHDRLKPTVENIALSFRGDGTIADPIGILRDLETKHCFTVTNGTVALFTTAPVSPGDIAKTLEKFHEFLSPKVTAMLEDHTKNYRQYSSGRFDIRVSDASHTTLTNITSALREKYGKGESKDNGSVCLWFVIAKNKEGQLQIQQKINSMLLQLRDHRILMFTFPTLAFCHDNANLWTEYARQYAQYLTENDGVAKNQIKSSLANLESAWFAEIKKHTTPIKVHVYLNGQIDVSDTSWNTFKDLISDYVRRTLPNCVDYLTQQITAFGNSGLKGWAMAGIQFNAVSGPQGQLVKGLKEQGISDSDGWFAQNPQHPLSVIHSLFDKKFANSVGKGGQQSIRKVYIELQRAPFGMRYNALSAFVLGFTLRDILTKNYQWTNGQLTKPLDMETLAEIIESVVKNNGNDNLKNEKLICRLSKEEKVFVEKSPLMFGVSPIANSTVESVLGQIQNRIENVSLGVPLWVLPEYIRSKNDERAELIAKVIGNVCTAFTTSSKGKTEERTNAVKDVGMAIVNDHDIVGVIEEYIKPEAFVRAFELYVDKENPALSELAKNVGDVSHEYCRTILEKTAEAAGWLWTPADISKEIDDMLCEYEVISLAKPLCGFQNFVTYKNVFDALKAAVTQTNRLPKAMLESAYPSLATFLSALQMGGSVQDIKLALSQSTDNIQGIFFDVTKKKSLEILKARLPGVALSDAEILNILSGISSGFALDEVRFIDEINGKIDASIKQSVVKKLKDEWMRLSGVVTPSEWAIYSGIPARFLFGEFAEAEDLLKAVEQPETFAAAKLTELLQILEETSATSITDCQNAFIAEVVPHKYAKFNISLVSLLEFLRKKYGTQPNNWAYRPDISEFIRIQYKGAFAPQIKERIRGKNAEELKDKLLELADEHPELGLLFWE